MARFKRGRKALYEVLSKAQLKPGYGRTLEKIREQSAAAPEPYGSGAGKPEPTIDEPVIEEKTADEQIAAGEENTVTTMPKTTVTWRRKPRVVQLNVGRIEFSMPYQLVVAIVLGLILLVLVAYRLGQYSYINKQKAGSPPVKAPSNLPKPAQPPANKTEAPAVSKDTTMPETTGPGMSLSGAGKNVIVIVEYKSRADLVPVQAHFAESGIETEIVSQGGRYLLTTKNRYDNPNTPGTDGYIARQKIVEVGAKYKGKAPEGYETFSPNFFKDAYGKRVD